MILYRWIHRDRRIILVQSVYMHSRMYVCISKSLLDTIHMHIMHIQSHVEFPGCPPLFLGIISQNFHGNFHTHPGYSHITYTSHPPSHPRFYRTLPYHPSPNFNPVSLQFTFFIQEYMANHICFPPDTSILNIEYEQYTVHHYSYHHTCIRWSLFVEWENITYTSVF